MGIMQLKNGKHEVRREIRWRAETQQDALRFERLLNESIVSAQRRFMLGDLPCISINDGLDDFLDYQASIEGNARTTLAAYRRRLDAFISAWGNIPLLSITREMVVAWVRARMNIQGKRRRYHGDAAICRDTINHDIKALRRFAKWAQETGRAPAGLDLLLVPMLKVRGKVKGNRMVPKTRVRHEFLRILRAIENAGYHHLAFVLRGMQLFLLREEALFQLTPRHVVMPTKISAGALDAPAIKHGPDGSIAIPYGSQKHKLLWDLFSFWRSRHGKPRKDDPLFITRRGRSRRRPGGWTTDAFDHELRRVCDKLGFHDFTAYQARHSIISWLQQQKGVSLADIQAAMRHLRVYTQDVYSHRSGRDGLSAFEAAERYMTRDADTLSAGENEVGNNIPATALDAVEFRKA